MAEINKPNDELQELRDRIAALEAELKEEKAKKADKKATGRSEEELTERLFDEAGKFSRGLVAASLETLAVAADITRVFANKTIDLSRGEKRNTATKQLTYLPTDMTEAMIDAMRESVEGTKKVIDKFRDEYKN